MENSGYPTDSQWNKFKMFLRDKFNLDDDKASQEEVVGNIIKGVDFRGTNLWVLIFATFVASIGLNVNSTAVIIGAMLISPLMGPIMGIGLSVGINDFMLFKRSLKNFGFMVLVAIVTATLYFLISPLSAAQSELLARTTPTTWDVFIALFGGLAGIVAQTRKDRTSTVIPGVAIATALMPPLCTAGFGLATGQINYFLGAAYLFFINTVFIAVGTYLIVRFLKYDHKVFVDKAREKKVKRYMTTIIILTIVPSVILGYGIVQQTLFETNADHFVTNVLKFEKAQVLDYTKEYKRNGSVITVAIIGEEVSEDAIANIQSQLSSYNLDNVELRVRQASNNGNVNMSIFQTNMEQLLIDRNSEISNLREKLTHLSEDTLPSVDISREISALISKSVNVAISKSTMYNEQGGIKDTVLLCLMQFPNADNMNDFDHNRLVNWLKARTKISNIKLYTETIKPSKNNKIEDEL